MKVGIVSPRRLKNKEKINKIINNLSKDDTVVAVKRTDSELSAITVAKKYNLNYIEISPIIKENMTCAQRHRAYIECDKKIAKNSEITYIFTSNCRGGAAQNIIKWAKNNNICFIIQEIRDEEEKNRVCKRCNEEKTIINFYYGSQTCKTCKTFLKKIYLNNNPIYKERQKQKSIDYKINQKLNNPIEFKAKNLFNSAKERSKKRKIFFDLQFITIKNKLNSNLFCEYCGKKFDLETTPKKGYHPLRPSIDRIDSKLGYIDNNVAIICFRCNHVKNSGTASEHRMIADYIDRSLEKIK